MNKNNEQNGRSEYTTHGSAPSTDLQTRNACLTPSNNNNTTTICRDFIWGICNKGARCVYRHERDVDFMKSVLKFCHDFQNKTGCLRADCTYLHTSREEQTLFFKSGKIPKVLADRYATMSVTPTSTANVNGMQQLGDNVAQYPRSMANYSMASNAVRVCMSPMMSQHSATINASHLHIPAPVAITVPMTRNASNMQLTQQQFTLPPTFDATKPPPPLPGSVSLRQKRKITTPEAGPSKARKLDDSEVLQNLCDNCVQRQIRIELIRQDLTNGQKLREKKNEVYNSKLEEYEHNKLMARSLLNEELYKFLEEYVEEEESLSVQSQELSSFNQISSLAAGLNSSNKPLMAQLLGQVIDNGTRKLHEQPSALVNSSENSFLKSLTSLTQARTTPVKPSTAEVFQTLLDLMCDRKVPEVNREAVEARSSDILSPDPVASVYRPQFNQFMSNQKGKSPSPESVPSVQSMHSPTMSPTSFGNMPIGVSNANAALVASPPPNIFQYQPNVPPPNTRPMYPPTMPTLMPTNVPNMNQFNSRGSTASGPSAQPQLHPGQNVPQYPANYPMHPHYYQPPPFQ